MFAKDTNSNIAISHLLFLKFLKENSLDEIDIENDLDVTVTGTDFEKKTANLKLRTWS